MRLTKADRDTIAYALCCAIKERDGFADAYSYIGVEAERAMMQVARFEALHLKMFGKQSAVADNADRLAAIPQVSIFSLERNDHEGE